MEKYKPTESELEILNILWENGQLTVKDVNDRLSFTKDVGYTTTLKIMQIMFDKKILSREKVGRSHVYKAILKKNDTQSLLIDKILETAFSGSASKLVMQAIGRQNTTKEELEEIKNYLELLEKEKNGTK